MILQWRKLRETPGEDGFSVEFYEIFLDLLGGNLLDCYLNEAFHEATLNLAKKRNHFPYTKK